jgi:hypothetical protein
MSYPEALKTFRSQLSFRRGQKRSVYEVLADDIDDDPGTKLIQAGVFNNEKRHWGIGCANHVFSFVWKCEHGDGCVSEIVGARCMVFPDFWEGYGQDLKWIGYTSLGIGEIKKAGTVLRLHQVDFRGVAL